MIRRSTGYEKYQNNLNNKKEALADMFGAIELSR